MTNPTAIPAVFKLTRFQRTGTAIFFSALISMLVLKIDIKTGLTTLKETFYELRWPILSIGMVLAFAFSSPTTFGMSSTMALVPAGTGAAFPFFSPFLGWLGFPDGLLTPRPTPCSVRCRQPPHTRSASTTPLLVKRRTPAAANGK